MARKVGQDEKAEEMPTLRVQWLGSLSRPSRIGHDPFTCHTQKIIMVKLIFPDENRMEGAHIYNREKYLNLTKELRDAGDKVVVMPAEIWASGFIGSTVYDLLTELSICGNKRIKALKLLAELADNSSCWIWSKMNQTPFHRD